MKEKYNSFRAKLITEYSDYEKLSEEYNIPITEIIQIDLNRTGVYLPNNEVRVDFRVRFKGIIDGDYETWYAVPVRSKEDTCFSVTKGKMYFKDKEIGKCTSEIMLDTCESSYQRGPHLLNLNSRSRSNCGGCKACVHNYKNFYDNTVIKDQKQLITEKDIEEFFDAKKIDVSSLVQIAVVTGLFHGELNVINHMKLIDKVAKKRNFKGELMYFGCEVNSDEALDELAKIKNFKLIYAIDNFTKRADLLSRTKGLITLETAKDTLLRAKKRGIKTTISYISGIDDLDDTIKGFEFLKESFTDMPIVNVYQIQNESQAKIMDEEAEDIEYYLKSRQALEKVFSDCKFTPKRWSNYRPLWYKYYQGEELKDNSFGQLEELSD